ncbi:unnamed protein product, partial [Brassica oleracea var. botrytis]
GRVEDKQTKIFRLSLCRTSSYNTTSVGLAYSHVNTSFSPRKCVAIHMIMRSLLSVRIYIRSLLTLVSMDGAY